jgi:uncharacterized protein
MSVHPRAAHLISTLDLQPHPEGGFYRELFRSSSLVTPADDRAPRAALTTIYFLLTSDGWSRWHQVRSDEAWHLYEGGPLELFEMDASASVLERHVLAAVGDRIDDRIGDRISDRGHEPSHVVAAGRWQAARSVGDYALMGCTVGPGFDFADFRMLGDDEDTAAAAREAWPELAFLV